MTTDARNPGAYLCSLQEALEKAVHTSPMTVEAFVWCCHRILPFFDHLGPVFYVARGEFQRKLDSLADCSLHTIAEVVEADGKTGTQTVKGSCTRNLHRLASALLFTQIIFQRLAEDSPKALREVAGEAYEAALAPFHTGIIRGVVRAGLITLPGRDAFLAAIGETPESVAARAAGVAQAAGAAYSAVSAVFAGITMPASDVWLWPSS